MLMDYGHYHIMNMYDNMYDERFKIIFITACMYRSFRLKNQRPLKNLLMLNEGGCGRLSPGIGDISYVKDLQTEEIVTTKFRCSQFSSHHSKSDGYGWVSFSRIQIFLNSRIKKL